MTAPSLSRLFAFARAKQQAEYNAEIQALMAANDVAFQRWLEDCSKLNGKEPSFSRWRIVGITVRAYLRHWYRALRFGTPEVRSER